MDLSTITFWANPRYLQMHFHFEICCSNHKLENKKPNLCCYHFDEVSLSIVLFLFYRSHICSLSLVLSFGVSSLSLVTFTISFERFFKVLHLELTFGEMIWLQLHCKLANWMPSKRLRNVSNHSTIVAMHIADRQCK